MKLLYIANARLPTEKAHGLHIVKMCEAFAAQGAEVTLVLPERKNVIQQDIFSYYGIKKNFEVRFVRTLDLANRGFLGYWTTQFFFSWKLFWLQFKDNKSVVITRDELSGWLMRRRGFNVFYDMHGFPETWIFLWKAVMKGMTGIICTNEWKMNKVHKVFGIPKKFLVLARNGFDLNDFDINITKEEARKILGLPLGRRIVLYAGHLYDWKGVDILARSAAFLMQESIFFIGGTQNDVDRFKKRHSAFQNVFLFGHQPHVKIPIYLRSADVLVLPNSRISSNPRAVPYSIYDTSPIKLFEYMASQRPIVASDLPSIREILNEERAVFFKTDDPEDLAKSIKYVFEHPQDAQERAARAWVFVQDFTWERRARRILEFIKNSLLS